MLVIVFAGSSSSRPCPSSPGYSPMLELEGTRGVRQQLLPSFALRLQYRRTAAMLKGMVASGSKFTKTMSSRTTKLISYRPFGRCACAYQRGSFHEVGY